MPKTHLTPTVTFSWEPTEDYTRRYMAGTVSITLPGETYAYEVFVSAGIPRQIVRFDAPEQECGDLLPLADRPDLVEIARRRFRWAFERRPR